MKACQAYDPTGITNADAVPAGSDVDCNAYDWTPHREGCETYADVDFDGVFSAHRMDSHYRPCG